MFPEPTELRLIGCLIESMWTTEIQIKYIDTKNQLADILTKGNFTRDHLLCLFNVSHFSSTDCSEVMSKRMQKRFRWRKISRCSVKNRNVLASSASESPGKTRCESQKPLSSWNEQHHRTGRLVKDAYSSSYSEWNVDKTWSSQEWKSDELMEVRTGRLVYEQPPGLFAQHTNVLVSTASKSPVKTKSESQNVPLSSLNVQQTRTGRPVLDASSSNYSEWNIDDKCGNLVKCREQVRGDPNMTSLSSMMIWTLTPPENRTFL